MRNYKIFILIVLFLVIKNFSFSQIDDEQILKFKQVINNIDNNYVDSVDRANLIKSAIVATLKELDPHSVYYDKDKLYELNRELNGSFVGVGIKYDIINDTVLILSVVPNGPSAIAGVLPGDRLIKVGNELIAGQDVGDDKLRDLLIGERYSEVMVSIKRAGQKEILEMLITRNTIPINSIKAAYKINDDIVYIKLKRFSASSINEFNKVIEKLDFKSSNKLILDLRGNGGGYLYVSVKLLENFLKKGTPVLFTKGIHNPEKEYKTHIKAQFKNTNLVVLINESSASASEIVSGAIQDWDRGVIVGRRSFGKGLVQKPYYLIDGSMMRLTIAKYYTPSGRSIQKPYNKGQGAYNKEIVRRVSSGELMHKDSIKHNDTLKYYTLNNKRLIYGGGGIMPDVYVELDTVDYHQFYRKFMNSGKLYEFVHLFVDKNRTFFKSNFSNFETFNSSWELSMKNIEELIFYLNNDEEEVINFADELFANNFVKNHLKALIANDIFGENEYYKIINIKDKTLTKAIEILSDKKKYYEILHNDIVGEYVEYK